MSCLNKGTLSQKKKKSRLLRKITVTYRPYFKPFLDLVTKLEVIGTTYKMMELRIAVEIANRFYKSAEYQILRFSVSSIYKLPNQQ